MANIATIDEEIRKRVMTELEEEIRKAIEPLRDFLSVNYAHQTWCKTLDSGNGGMTVQIVLDIVAKELANNLLAQRVCKEVEELVDKMRRSVVLGPAKAARS